MNPINKRISGIRFPLSQFNKAQGFTLLEVLVALVIIAVGLLGIAGMNALAINNSAVARNRGMAATMASSLAASISANKAYWGGITTNGDSTSYSPPTTSFTIVWSTTSATLGDSTLNALATDCTSSVCTPVQMAAYDLKQWGHDLKWSPDGGTTWYWQIPNGQGAVQCYTTPKPNECVITVTWSEKNLRLKHDTTTPTSSYTQSYVMVVKP